MLKQCTIIMRMKYTGLGVIIQILSFKFGVSQFVGDGCELDFRRTGKCTHVEECPEAIKQIRNRGHPKMCGFQGLLPIVCCETKLLERSIEFGSIAKKKCIEYAITSITTTTTTTTTPRSPSNDGISQIFGIGGEDAEPLEFPHMAVLGYGSSDDILWRCGGSLISENFVLTAAHCVRTKIGKVQYVKLGVHQLDTKSQAEETFRVKNFSTHPNYVRSQYYHDIALIELDRSANIQSGVKPGCLHTTNEVPNSLLVATGWGAVELHGDIYNTLQKVNLSHVPNDVCTKYYADQGSVPNGVAPDWQICADGGGARADTCQGDSGGPLQTKSRSDSLYTIIGITSLGLKCAVVPGIYTRVSHYVPWIEGIVWPSEE